MAQALETWNIHGLPMNAVTIRRTKNGKVAHLFVTFVDGAMSGYPVSFCDRVTRYDEKWTEAPDLTLCNRCGRAFRKEKRKLWKGEP